MESLFRLALVRPPVRQDPRHPSINLAQETTFQQELAEALGQDNKRASATAVAQGLIASDTFVDGPDGHELSAQTARLAAGLAALEHGGTADPGAVAGVIEAAFGAPAADVAASDSYARVVSRLRDSIIAVKYVQEEHGRPLEALSNQLRDLEVVAEAAADSGFPADAADLQRHRTRSLQLPTSTGLASILSTADIDEERRKNQKTADTEKREQVSALLNRYLGVASAVNELTRFQAADLRSTTVDPGRAVDLPEELVPVRGLTEQVAFSRRMADLTLRHLETASSPDQRQFNVQLGQGTAELARTTLAAAPRLFGGKPAFIPPVIADVGFRVTPAAAQYMSESTKAVLSERGIDLAERPLDRAVEQLRDEVDLLGNQIDGFFAAAHRTSIKRVGTSLVAINTPRVTPWTEILFAGGLAPLVELAVPDRRIPHTRGEVAPAGIADLLVVKQQLIGYEAADVAHIENVLKGEAKSREHSRRRETEELTFLETETASSEEHELESTTRFEMSRETSSTIREDAALKAGLTVSGKYGPTVEFAASAEGSVSRSRTEATKSASSFSQDVTERSATKLTKRILERSSLRVTNEVTERNEHTLDNTTGDAHISGVYQWVNKVYQVQMFNYGLRTMFDFMVPEPAAMLINIMQSAHASETSLAKPPDFTLLPSQLTEGNYGYWVRTYNAADVTPPPDIYTTVALDYSAGGGDEKTDYNHSGQLTIPDGYQALHGTVGVVSNTWQTDGSADVVLGRRSQRIGGGVKLWSTSLDEERGAVPFALNTWRLSDVAVAVEVKCQRTVRALQQWAAETHAKLTNAYKARLAEYEEKLSTLEIRAGISIEGKNPALNQELMQDELKKHCLSILTNQHFDLFGAVEPGFTGLPQIDVFEAAAEGSYVRFFEQAWEWEQMTWVTYPYFWGRKDQWDERIGYDDPDPLFSQFLKAGFCRVSVPARPGFEGAIDHFLSFGELWNGGPLPTISSPLYLPIGDEIAERLNRPGKESAQGDPWLLRVPTSLVTLPSDGRLPHWTQNNDGEWVET